MNNTYKFLKAAIAGFTLLGFTSCINDDIVDYRAKDTETLESYLNENAIDYYKTSTLPSGDGVYITPNGSQSLFPRDLPQSDGKDTRIFELKLDLRRFDQGLIGDEQVDTDPDNLVTTVFLKDSTYTFSMRRGAICLGVTDAVLNVADQTVDRIYVPSYLAFGGTASTSVGLEFNDIVTLEDFEITEQRTAFTQASKEYQDALQYAMDSIDGFNGIEDQGLVDSTSVVAENYFSDDSPVTDLVMQDFIVKHTITEGLGPQVNIADTVQVRYEGKFIDQNGEVFDSNTGSDKSKFQVIVYKDINEAQEKNASSTVINGWYKALRSMRIGEKAIFVMPSHTAYWETGDNPNTTDLFKVIRPFKTLVFTIELKADEQ